MTSFPGSPRVLKGGLVLVDPETAAVLRVIVLQYNPDTLTRTLQPQGVGGDGSDRAEPLRLKAPPQETIRLEAEIDATDQLEFPDSHQRTVEAGIHPDLAALETIVYPPSGKVAENRALVESGEMEIIPVQAPLMLFVWSKNRVLPVKLTELSITEEAFDTALNPIRAKITLAMRVLNANDLGYGHKGASLFLTYHRQKEALARMLESGSIRSLGIQEMP